MSTTLRQFPPDGLQVVDDLVGPVGNRVSRVCLAPEWAGFGWAEHVQLCVPLDGSAPTGPLADDADLVAEMAQRFVERLEIDAIRSNRCWSREEQDEQDALVASVEAKHSAARAARGWA